MKLLAFAAACAALLTGAPATAGTNYAEKLKEGDVVLRDFAFASGERLPERVDAVFETVGHATWAHSMRALRPGGVIVVSGATTGPNPGADLQRLFFLQLRVVGATMGTRAELADLLTFVTNAGIAPQIGLELPLERAEEGFRALAAGETGGKIVFTR